MKITLTDPDIVQVLNALKEKKNKHLNLSALAGSRSIKAKYSKNAEKLRTEHKSKSATAQNLINKIVEQL